MATNHFSTELAAKLIAKGLPLSYVKRTVEELSDHQQDLADDFFAAGCSREAAEQKAFESMGDIEHLSEALRDRLRNSTVIGRHPAWSFLLFPLLSVVLFIFLSVLLVSLVGNVMKMSGIVYYQEPLRSILMTAIDLLPIMICVFSAVIFCVLNRRCCCDIKWAGYACLLLGILGYGLAMQLGLNAPEIGRDTNTIAVGFGLGMPKDWQAPLRFALPMVSFLVYYVISRTLRAAKI